MILLIIYIGVLNQNVYVFEIFSFFLNISFLNIKAYFNQLLNLFQIMLSSRPYALMDTFLFLVAFSLVSQYVISSVSVNGIKFRLHHTHKCICQDQCTYEENCSQMNRQEASWQVASGKWLCCERMSDHWSAAFCLSAQVHYPSLRALHAVHMSIKCKLKFTCYF